MSRGERRSRRESQVFRIKILIAAVVVISLFVFIFSTNTIHVTGNEHESGEEVRAMLKECPVWENTAALFLWNIAKPVKDRNFIDYVSLQMTDTHTILATVHEKQLAGYFEHNGGYWYFDRKGVIAAFSENPETSLSAGKTFIPLIFGLTAGSPQAGDYMPGANTGLYERLGNLQTILNRRRLIPDRIEVSEDFEVSVTYGKITAELGNLEFLETRMQTLWDILPQAEGLEGTLLLSEYDGSEEGVVFRRAEREEVIISAEPVDPARLIPAEEIDGGETGGEEETETTEEPEAAEDP